MKIVLYALAVVVAVLACKREDQAGSKDVVATAVSLDKKEMTLEEEAQERLSAIFSPSNASGQDLVWESSDECVAVVSEGTVTGILPGQADVIVHSGELTDTCRVTVVDKKIDWDSMGHVGQGHRVDGSMTVKVEGTEYTFENWSENGNTPAVYYDNGTFSASWGKGNYCYSSMGFDYRAGETGVDPATRNFVADFKYTKSGSADVGDAGVYLTTTGSISCISIIDGIWGNVSPSFWGSEFGEYTLDGATYKVYLREVSVGGLYLNAVRNTSRSFGRIHVSEHLKKWNTMFYGQEETVGGKKFKPQIGNILRVTIIAEVMFKGGGGAVDFTYLDLRQ